MSTVTTRAGKGSALTHNELDANFKTAAQTKAAAYTIAESDNRDTVEYSGAGAEAFTLPDAATVVAASDTGDFEVTVKHKGAGVLTVGRTTGADTIDGTAADITLAVNDSVVLKVNQAGDGYNIIARKLEDAATKTGTETLTNKTLTSPDIDQVVDSAGNEVLIFGEVASAVNELTMTNAATGNNPSVVVSGEDVGVDIEGVTLKNGIATVPSGLTVTAGAVDFPTDSVSRADRLEAGCWVFIEEKTPSGFSLRQFTDLSSAYDMYILVLENLETSAAADIILTTSTDNGATYDSTNYRYHTQTLSTNAATYSAVNSNSAASIILAKASGGNDATTGTFYLPKPTAASHFTIVYGDYGLGSATGGGSMHGSRAVAESVNAIKVALSTGTFAGTGTMKLYGLKND
jgi:hypothetical protein